MLIDSLKKISFGIFSLCTVFQSAVVAAEQGSTVASHLELSICTLNDLKVHRAFNFGYDLNSNRKATQIHRELGKKTVVFTCQNNSM